MMYNKRTVRILAVCFALVLAFIIAVANMGLGVAVYGHLCTFHYFDKVGHFFLMGTLSFLVNLSLDSRTVQIYGRPFLLGSLIVCTLVLLEECTQLWMPHRNFQVSDLACDGLGIFVLGRFAAWISAQRQSGSAQGEDSEMGDVNDETPSSLCSTDSV